MRDSWFICIEDDYKYSFGSDVSIVVAIMKIAKEHTELTHTCYLTGKELIEFIKEKVPSAINIISNIKEENHYKLVGEDW